MSRQQKSLKLNAFMNAILTTASFAFPLITFPYVSRILLPEGTGKVSFAGSVVSYFVMLAQLGIPTYGIRACAKVRDDEDALNSTIQEIAILNLIIAFITYIVLVIVVVSVPRFYNEKTIYIILSLQIVFNTVGMEWLYKALEQYTYITIRSIAFKFVAVVATFLLIREKSDYGVYAGITIFASSASNVLNFINLRCLIHIKRVRVFNLKRHLKPIFIFFAMSCATTIYTNLDNVMLGFMKTETEVGLYNAAVKIRNILVSVVTSLGVVLLPRASYYYENRDINGFYRITGKALNIIMLISIPAATFFYIFAKEGIYFLSGNAYEGAVKPMQIIMATVVFIGMTNILGIQMLVPMGKESIVLLSEIVGAIVNLLINYYLIPLYGAIGAAISTVVAEIVVWIVQLYVMRNDVGMAYKQIHFMKIGMATISAVISSYWVKYIDCTDFIRIMLSGMIFFAVYGLLLLFVFKDELMVELLNQFINKLMRRK